MLVYKCIGVLYTYGQNWNKMKIKNEAKIETITKHQQLANIIEEKIKNGEFLPGEKLPSERTLAKIYGISHMTVNKALAFLVGKGILKRVHGNGTYIIGDRDFISTKIVAIAIPADIENHPLFYPALPNLLYENGYFPVVLNTQSTGVVEKFEKIITQIPKSIIIEPLNPELTSFYADLKNYENVFFIHKEPYYEIGKKHKQKCNFIYVDYQFAGYIGMKTLLENQRKNIIVLSYERRQKDVSDLFLSGCEKALKEYNNETLYFLDTNVLDEYQYEKIIKKRKVDGILSLGDFRLIPVLKTINNLGFKVPDDIQLIGTYNTLWAKIYGLTSISINQEEIMKEVLQCLKEGKRGYIKKISPYIVFRNSCPKSRRR